MCSPVDLLELNERTFLLFVYCFVVVGVDASNSSRDPCSCCLSPAFFSLSLAFLVLKTQSTSGFLSRAFGDFIPAPEPFATSIDIEVW